jgi:hypothetical protein
MHDGLTQTKRGVSLMTKVVIVIACAFALTPRTAKAEPMREFVMSASYGVLAGTLVGVATLAFTDRPGDNLNKVARGASLGLYAGILLGAYIVYGVPSEEEEPIPGGIRVQREPPSFQIYPLISERGFEGAAAHATLLRF